MRTTRKCIAFIISAALTVSFLPAIPVIAAGNTAPAAPTGLLTNDLENPLNAEAPVFGWIVNDADENEIQTAYEIVVTDEITNAAVWDSGKVTSSEQAYIPCGGSLDAGHPYSWKVKTWDKDGAESPYSDSAYFATGLIGDDGWGSAKWISDGTDGATVGQGKYNHFWYTRTMRALKSETAVVKALGYFSGLQDYDLYINGEEIGRGQSFDYAEETRYQGWDITDAVNKDSVNVTVGALVRNYGGGQGRAAVSTGFLGYIKIYYSDGSTDIITTDTSGWKVSKTTPFTENSTTRGGEGDFVEKYDARKEQADFSKASFNDSSWTAAVDRVVTAGKDYKNNVVDTGVITKPIPELSKPTAELVKPVSVQKVSGGYLADFGKVIPARPQITFKNGTDGKKVTINTGYVILQNGRINTAKAATQSTDMTFEYTQKNGEQVYNAWDHLGFRYIYVPECGEEFTTETIAAKVVHTNVPDGRGSTLTTSNEMLNRVYELMKRSSLYSIQNSFVDTPTREKGQFTDDARNISEASMATQFEREATRKALAQFIGSADRFWNSGDDLGRVNSVYPNIDGKRDIPEYSVNFPQFVWNYYMVTGDKAMLEKAYPYMKNAADYITRSVNASTGLVTKLAGGSSSYEFGIVDWPAAGRFGYDWNGTKDGARTTVNMLSKHAFDVVALAAAELDRADDKADMESRSASLKNAINSKLVNSNGLYCDGTGSGGSQVSHVSQHANSYALAFDVATDENKSKVAEYVASNGMRQGPMTADLLLKGLFNAGENGAALKLLTNPDDKGWAYEVNNGYTFTFESWDAYSSSNEDSHSHGWGSTASSDILKNLAGVTPLEAGYKKIKIAPVYADLASLDANVSTERGAVKVKYERDASKYDISVTVPANVQAQIDLPIIGSGEFKRTNGTASGTKENGVQTFNVGSGTYNFSYDGAITVRPEDVPEYEVKEEEPFSYDVEEFDGIKGSNNSLTSVYTWEIGNGTADENGTTYSDSSDYADLTVSLAKGDSMLASIGIVFEGSSVGEINPVNDTKRYILVKPKYDGTLSLDISFATAASNKKNRVYYRDLGTSASVDLTQYKKEGTQLEGDITDNGIKTKTLNVTSGHTYILYTYQSGSTVSAMSFKYTGAPAAPTATPTTAPTSAPTAAPTSAPTQKPDGIEIIGKSVAGGKVDYTIGVNGISDGVLITAVINGDGTLYSAQSKKLTGDDINVSVTVPDNSMDIKFMVWDGLKTMKPLAKAVTDKHKGSAPSPTRVPETTATPSATITPYEPPEEESSSIHLDRVVYPLVVGNSSKTDFSRWEDQGSEITITASLDAGKSVADLSWAVEDDDIAYITSSRTTNTDSIRVKGKRTGVTKLTASLPDGDKAVCYLSVIDNVTRSTVQTLEFNTDSLLLMPSMQATLIPIINPKDVFGNGALDTSLTWSTSNANVATVSDGVVTAVANGMATITATSNDVGRTAECKVTVTDTGYPVEPQPDDIMIPDLITMSVGETQQIVGGTGITLRSDDPSAVDVDENGVVTAYASTKTEKLMGNENYVSGNTSEPLKASEKKTVFEEGKVVYEQGPVKVYATAPNGTVTMYLVSVSDAPVTVHDVVISEEKTAVEVGDTKTIKAAILPASAMDKRVAWKSSDPSVASVSENALTVEELNSATVTGVSRGTATITAECDGIKAECVVTVGGAEPGIIDITNASEAALIDIDEIVELNAQSDVTGGNPEIVWLSSDADTVTVSNDGIVQGLKTGAATIYAIAADMLDEDGRAAVDELRYARKASAQDVARLRAIYGGCTVEVKESSPYLRNLHIPAETITDNSVNLLWNSASKMDIPDLESYNVYVNGELAANTKMLGCTVEGLEADTAYEFKVEAVTANDEIHELTVDARTKKKSVWLNVLDYGAKGNGRNLDTYAIQKAIDACPENGTVYLPKGYTFYSGALFLKSNMTFKLDGILLGSPYSKDYPFMVTRWEGWRKVNQKSGEWANTTASLPDNHYAHASLINAGTYDEGEVGHAGHYNVENIVICGMGQINGNGFKLGYNEGVNQKTGDGGIPVPMSPALDQTIRGRLITVHNADGFYMKDVQAAYGPSWTIHPIYSKNMTFDNLDIIARGSGKTGAADDICILNGDGLDPDSSVKVNIFNTFFYAGDDAIAIKTGRNREGNELKKPTQFIRVTDSESNTSKGGFAVGSENASGVRNLMFQNLKIVNPKLSHGVWFKTYWSRGGLSEDLIVRDIDSSKPLNFSMAYATAENNPAVNVPEYRYLTVENVNNSIQFEGIKAEKGHSESYVNRVTVRGAEKGGTIDRGKDFTIWDSSESKWTIKNSGGNINFAYSNSDTNTRIKVKDGAEHIASVDNESLVIIAKSGTAEDVKNEIESAIPDSVQTYSVNGNILTVTAPDGVTTADYTISFATVWDFAKYTTEVKTTESGFTESYDGLTIAIANNGGDSDHDKITTGGVYWRGGAKSGESPRYIAYTPEVDGVLTVTGKVNTSQGRFGISESLVVTSLVADSSSSTSQTETTITKECTAGKTYYIIPKDKSATVTSVAYAPN